MTDPRTRERSSTARALHRRRLATAPPRIVEHVGFKAAYMGGHATGMMHRAIPDNGVFSPTEMIEIAGHVAEAIEIPLVVDADQAGESVADVYRSIRHYERAGVAGVHIEDEIAPKHSSWDGPLLPIPDMQAHRTGSRPARRQLIIARLTSSTAPAGRHGSLET
jgi:2-methylisocitrate lyase-like PEP mutase family enzyme